MKVALCFIISYKHILHKEEIWKLWIDCNKDLFNIYFYYSDYKQIKSEWIKSHCIPSQYISRTDYLHIIPAYFGLMTYAYTHDSENRWFCFLTDTCVPIIHPSTFKTRFLENCDKSFLSWSKSNWNINYVRRANLNLLNKKYHLKNTPYFVLCKDHVLACLNFSLSRPKMFRTISNGSIANESLFAIIFQYYGILSSISIENTDSTLTDWSRPTSPTSPFVFIYASKENIDFIHFNLQKEGNKLLFLRKVDKKFSDKVLLRFLGI
jgi:hypothetical protein